MGEEHLKVLQMLSDGKLDVREADKLLRQLPPDGGQEGMYGRHHNRHGGYWHREFLGQDFVENIIENIVGETAGFGRQFHAVFSSEPVAGPINRLQLAGKNDSVDVYGYSGDCIKLDVTYKLKRGVDPMFAFKEDNGGYRLLYDEGAVSSVKIVAEVPRVHVGQLFVESKNASVTLRGLEADNCDLRTKNAGINARDVKCGELSAQTSNASIDAERVDAPKITITTSNAGVKLEQSRADMARLSTSNASVQTRGNDVRQLYINTSNAGIRLEDGPFNGQYPLYSVDAHTSNGNITAQNIRVPIMLRASTSFGHIDLDLPDFKEFRHAGGHVELKSPGYDDARQKLDIALYTSNGSIKVM
ncbi:MAG: DUF4097 family beta strand repeat-containing protein [Clostridiales bacterium]|jgi:hypothetical protein|nr:DUF4097 family beta strand repeat-containing protein [Clostridiales bacterium]